MTRAWYDDGKRWEEFEGFQIAIPNEDDLLVEVWRGRDLYAEVRSVDAAERMIRDAIDYPTCDEAVSLGCTCRMGRVYSTMIDPPEPVINRNCQLHGDNADPDYLRETRDERRAERRVA